MWQSNIFVGHGSNTRYHRTMKAGIILAMIALLLIITTAVRMAAEDLSTTDQAALDKATNGHMAQATKAYEAYQQALNDANAKAIKDLEALKTKATKAGNLTLANAVVAKEKEVNEGSLNTIIVAQANTETDLLGNQVDAKTIIVNKWKEDAHNGWTGVAIFNADGTCTIDTVKGKYTMDAAGIVTIKWESGKTDTINIIKENKMEGKAGTGEVLTYTK